MVWIWIVVAIVVIALIIWLLLARRRRAQSDGQSTVGRHVASADRGDDSAGPSGAAGSSTPPADPAGRPVFDQEAETGGAPDAAPVLHTTGSTGEEQVVASGSVADDAAAAARAEQDAEVAAVNDDPQVRPADAPAENPATAIHQDDAELPDTPVLHPHEGVLSPGSGDSSESSAATVAPANTPTPQGGFAAPVAGSSQEATAETGGAPEAAAESVPSAGATVGYAVERAGASGGPGEPGADPMTERFGAGAASSRPDGSAPEGHPIKGNADSMLFHTPDSPRYDATDPAVWFRDESSARAAGFAHWDRTKRDGAVPGDEPVPGGEAPSALPAEETAGDTVGALPADANRTEAASALPATEAAPADEGSALPGSDSGVADDDPMRAQFGDGAASPRQDGSAPSGRYVIKGNADSMLFHTPDSPHYEVTEVEVWFIDEESAKAAGFQHWDHRKR